MSKDYAANVTKSLKNDPNDPIVKNDNPLLYHNHPTVSERPGIVIPCGTQLAGLGGSTDGFTLQHRDSALEADFVVGLQFTICGVTGPDAAFFIFNGVHTVTGNNGAWQGQYSFNFEIPTLNTYT